MAMTGHRETSDISVVVGTYGDDRWHDLASERAVPSIRAQTRAPADYTHIHMATLHEARNAGAAAVSGRWLVFLDADDELDPNYIEAMQATIDAASMNADEGGFLLQPRTIGINDETGVVDADAVFIPAARSILDRNWMVIGTGVRRDQFLRVGGFRAWDCYEDWDLWIRCLLDGARPHCVHGAIYRVHVRPGSRNNGDAATQTATYHAIRGEYLAEATVKGLAA